MKKAKKKTVKAKKVGPWHVGKNYFVRTVTHHLTGKLVAVYPTELVFVSAAWIADDGRFHDFITTGNANEVEPWADGEVVLGRGSIIDAQVFNHELLTVQK